MAIIKKCTNNKAGEGVKKREPSYTVGRNVNWCNHYGDQYGDSFKKLKIELPFDSAIPLLGIDPEKILIPKDTCTPMFILALFTIAKTWKQPKRPSTEEWIKKMRYIYTQWNITQPYKRIGSPAEAQWDQWHLCSTRMRVQCPGWHSEVKDPKLL